MKIPTEGAATAASITKRVADKEGLGYDTVASLKGVVQMDQLDDRHAVILTQDKATGMTDLSTIELP